MVILFYSLTHITCMALHHTVVIRYSTSVTYRTICHTSGHLVIYRECCGFERTFSTLRYFLPCTPSCFFEASLGSAAQPESYQDFMLIFETYSLPDCLFESKQSTKRFTCDRSYLRARASQSQNINLHRELVSWNISFEIFASYEI